MAQKRKPVSFEQGKARIKAELISRMEAMIEEVKGIEAETLGILNLIEGDETLSRKEKVKAKAQFLKEQQEIFREGSAELQAVLEASVQKKPGQVEKFRKGE